MYTPEALQVTSGVLSQVPDFSSIWNYRREILLHLWKCVLCVRFIVFYPVRSCRIRNQIRRRFSYHIETRCLIVWFGVQGL